MNSLFEYNDYRAFLRDWIKSQPKGGHGCKLRMAGAIGCHTSYVTFILSGRVNLSLEQAASLAAFLGLSPAEQDFFFVLVQIARAGTKELKGYFLRQRERLVDERGDLKNRLLFKKTLSREDQMTYYSSWHYAVIHMLVAGEAYRTREAIARFLGLPKKKVGEILDFLVSIGLMEEEGGSLRIGVTSIHLERDSPLVAKHHTNWRMQAIRSLDTEGKNDLHYSSVAMISAKDAEKIRAALVKAIEEVRSVVRDSKEEHCYCYCLDFFPVR